jgi:hypothetical protein
MLLFPNRRGVVAGALFATLASSAAGAVTPTQGTLGGTSTGTVGISATVPPRVQITGLADFDFSTLDVESDASISKNVCVWSNTSTKGYNITASGSGASSAFTLASGTNTLPYSVQWAGSSGQATGSSLTSGTAKTGLTSTATAPTCGSGPTPTASLIVKITSAQALAAVGSATPYTGTLTLVVAPE